MLALTQEERAEIVAVYLETQNQLQTAKRTHHSTATINKVVHEADIANGCRGAKQKATDDELINAAQALTLNEIAAKYKMHTGSVRRRCWALGVRPVGYGVRKKPKKEPPKIMRVCPVCGTLFEGKTNKKTCGAVCAKVREDQKRRERYKAKSDRLKAKRIEYRKQHEIERACAICGGLFYCLESETIKTCSHECAMELKNRRHDKRIPSARLVDRITVKALYRRDAGRCYICGGLCNWNDWRTADSGNKYPGDTYPTIDHVLPVSKGGCDSWDNVRLAHWRCNLQKADGVIDADPLTKEFAYSQKRSAQAAKKTKQYTLDGVLIRVWDSTAQIRRETGLSDKHIQNVCRGEKRTNKAFGYRWEYA